MKRAITIAAMLAAAGLAGAQMFAQLFGQTSRLPAGYTELQYVVSTNATINTLWVAQPTSTIEIEISQLNPGNSYLWGYLVDGPANAYLLELRGGTHILTAWMGMQAVPPVSYGTGKHTWRQAGAVVYFDGVPIFTNSPGTAIVSANMVVGTRICNTTPDYLTTGTLVAKIYSIKLWTGAVIEREFIPVTDNSGIPALYDLVGKTTHYKVTGSLYAGPRVN